MLKTTSLSCYWRIIISARIFTAKLFHSSAELSFVGSKASKKDVCTKYRNENFVLTVNLFFSGTAFNFPISTISLSLSLTFPLLLPVPPLSDTKMLSTFSSIFSLILPVKAFSFKLVAKAAEVFASANFMVKEKEEVDETEQDLLLCLAIVLYCSFAAFSELE